MKPITHSDPGAAAAVFAGFETHELPTSRGTVHAVVGGSGPALLLLHGYPQFHVMWHAAAPLLAERHTVVATDLAGYGASSRPAPAPDHAPHSKRAMALDQVEAMAALGFERFSVAGHDRGGRVAYRMALDRPDRVQRLAVLDIVPTGEVWRRADRDFARGYWHWAFLAQPAPLPERLIGGDPQAFFDFHVRAGMGLGAGPGRYPPEILNAYRRILDDPDTVNAMCEDYRAGASIDLAHDDADREAGRTIACPVLVLWAARGGLPRFYPDVLDVWRPWAPDVRGEAVDATHFLAEDRPEQTAAQLLAFLADA
jgi:haloacetate dehalogenase